VVNRKHETTLHGAFAAGNVGDLMSRLIHPTKVYTQDDATGFIRLNALRLKVAARVQRKK